MRDATDFTFTLQSKRSKHQDGARANKKLELQCPVEDKWWKLHKSTVTMHLNSDHLWCSQVTTVH